MGKFTIVIEAVGGHGCQREIGNGGTVESQICKTSHHANCIDCRAREFVLGMKALGYTIQSAVLTHWPDDADGGIKDDLVTGIRTGSFQCSAS